MADRRYVSPLRYPGGKAAMAPWLATLFAQQSGWMDIEVWVEPFAGGAGAGLTLLDDDAVDEVWLVDQNPAIAAFWRTVVDEGARLATAAERATPTMALYEQSLRILADSARRASTNREDPYDLGFAAFIVNRCSRSGIIAPHAGVIGGKKQTGDWTVTSRFNGPELADRIRHIHAMRSRIHTHHGDGISFIEDLDTSGVGDEVVLFVDPPYIKEGNRLYAQGLDRTAHARLSNALNGTATRWVLTYDDHPDVGELLYPERRVLAYGIRNNANRARAARELAVLSDNIDLRGLGAPVKGRAWNWVRDGAQPLAA